MGGKDRRTGEGRAGGRPGRERDREGREREGSVLGSFSQILAPGYAIVIHVLYFIGYFSRLYPSVCHSGLWYNLLIL